MSLQIPRDDTLIEDVQQLIDYMALGGKPRARWVVGTEHEKLGFWPDEGDYPTFEGPRGIGVLFEGFAARGWVPVYEGPHIVGLFKDNATITLEPGGQLELSGAPLGTLAETAAEFDAHIAELSALSAPLGIIWSGLGMAPIKPALSMPRMPKARYGIMRGYLVNQGALAMRMMHQTCTVQANFDFADEADAMRKLRAALYLQPLVMAGFANSTVADGHLLNTRSYRGRIWEQTDANRYIFPRRFLEPGATLADYVSWAISVPMFFIVRGGEYIDCAGVSFRVFMKRGIGDHRATIGDFALHLSTLFPDARLKHYLEVRGADMGPRDYVLALPALHKGIFYDDVILEATLRRFERLDYEAWWRLRRAVPRLGLEARLPWGETAQEALLAVFDLAKAGLTRVDPTGLPFLEPVRAALEIGETPADVLRAGYRGPLSLFEQARVA
ncbi:glutamate--cysteine ligase [Myxococcota bacterium]|nr:glutamate--cysteine ligase [Myxococcota bacterium]MBU1430525.1 glutamate--cysteine ligase [Myxococcota bacterium]MBU1900221.1 glutamate--cysteine ligase [Myxococcota bacterium]